MFTHLKTTLLLIALATPALAQGPAKSAPASQPAAQGQGGEKMDVSDLEKKYWSAKDTDYNVVQNRVYSKANRLGLTLNLGGFSADPYSKGLTYSTALSYYFSERAGVEVTYAKTDSSDNDSTSYIKTNQGSAPNHNKMKGYYGLGFNWVPFYAKMSFLTGSIIYFDMSITPGVGMMMYQQQAQDGNVDKTAPAVSVAITQHFFLTKWLAVRFDYKNFWSNQDVITYKALGRTTSTTLQNDSLLMGGFTFFF